MTVGDFPDFMGVGQQAAAMIASGTYSGTPGGTPLLHGYILVTDNTTWTAAAANSYFSQRFVLPSPSYQFAIRITISNAAATVPFARVVLSFLTAASGGVKVDEVDFYVPATSSGTYWIYGAGPATTQWVQVQVQNLDPTYTMSGEYVLGSSTLQKARHDWRSFPGGNIPGIAQPQVSQPTALVLGASVSAGVTIAAGTLANYLLPLYAGQAIFNVNVSAIPNPAATYTVLTPAGMIGGAGNEFTAWELSSTAQFVTSQAFALPRAPCLIVINNNNAANPLTFDWGITALEYAS